MKSYKLVNSEEVREKAERLGYVEGCTKFDQSAPFLIVYDDIYYSHGMYNVHNMRVEEITQKDFLALPEPLKVDDWFFLYNASSSIDIRRVDSVDGDKIYFDGRFTTGLDSTRKLTEEQMEILGLE